ncbi:MAG: hypothetical protein LBQ27_03665 [Clostridiales bacterium]|jgi:hypothetical protein|nr:hypothetical protein [Clostridiales bacterium]
MSNKIKKDYVEHNAISDKETLISIAEKESLKKVNNREGYVQLNFFRELDINDAGKK